MPKSTAAEKTAPDASALALAQRLSGRSPDDVAIDMIAKSAKVGKVDDEGKPIKDTLRDVEDEDFTDDVPLNGGVEDEDDEIDDDTGEEVDDLDNEDGDDDTDETEDEDEEADEGDGEEFDVLDYDDDDLINVTVDGEVREVSLRDLKKAYSGEGAIEKRLKDATELRKAAQAERQKVDEEIAEHRTNLLQTIQQLDGVLFAPLVPEPDPKLRQRNMQEYLMQKDAYEEDQKRIVKLKGELQQFFGQQQQQRAQQLATLKQQEAALLVEKLPELRDPEKGPKIQRDIMDAATYYGFTPQQVAQVQNHGLFLMARDAARWLQLQKIKKTGKVPSVGETKGRRRRLRAGGVASKKAAVVRASREQKAIEAKAKASGRVDDIANLIASKAKVVKGKNDGRRG